MSTLWRFPAHIVSLSVLLFICSQLFADAARASALFKVQLEIKDGVFTPQTIAVPVGQKIHITLINAGHSAAEFESVALRKEKVLAPGAASFIVIAPLREGRYTFFDDFHIDMPHGVIVAG